ncbi:MAG TPA: (4Fe-4S)-binding protein [Bacteroidia bacterium]|nr:(4Fe-4S)-binding protein [Bacteroidia bacterium]
MKEITKHYVKDDLTIIWKPHVCIHSTKCFRGMPSVFDPGAKPWITPEGASKEEIIRQIKLCPSGALSYTLNSQEPTAMENQDVRIAVLDKGPYLVKGKFIIVNKDGKEESKEGNIALCRCGLSKNKPFCDGTHRTTDVLHH